MSSKFILFLLAIATLLVGSPALAQNSPASPDAVLMLSDTTPSGSYLSGVPVVVVVDKEKHLTHAYQLQNNQVVEVLSIPNAVGKHSTPTPSGRTTVKAKTLDPVWVPPTSIDPQQRAVRPYSKDKHNPLGVAFIATNKGLIGLHGTNAPGQIGRSVSHGCIRHKNEDILKLYDMVSVGTPIYLVNHLDGTKVLVSDFTAAR